MKNNVRSLFILWLIAILVVSMAACNKTEPYAPASAAELWDKIDATMNLQESMEITSAANATFYSGGYTYQFRSNSYILATKDVHYTENTSTLSCDALSHERITKMAEAYYNGRIYIAAKDDLYDQKLCSEMTHEEYDQIQNGTLTEQIDMVDCTASEFSKNADGGWDLHFSGYTKKAIDSMLEATGLVENSLSTYVTDMQINLSADAEFRVRVMEIRFVFNTAEELPVPEFSVKTEYSGYNTAVFDVSKLKTEEYTLVADVRLLNIIQQAIEQRQNASSGTFSLDIKNTYERAGNSQTAEENNIVTYGRNNGAFYYVIHAQMDGGAFELRYQNNKQTVINGDESLTAPQSESEAKTFINTLINSAKYSPKAVTDIQEQAEGVYVLTIGKIDIPQFLPNAESNGIEVLSANQQCTVTFSNGKLMKIESKVILNGTHSDEAMVMTGETTVVFDDTAHS